MPTVTIYPSGTTAGTSATTHHVPETKRGEVAGWSREAARRHKLFLMSVDAGALVGVLYSFTLTVRDTPTTAREWAALRNAWLTRLRTRAPADRAASLLSSSEPSSLTESTGVQGPQLLAYHWVTEWQKRGTPHTHGALVWSRALTSAERAWVRRAWMEVARPYRASWGAQEVSETLSAGSWARYVAKHSARSAGHAQRSEMPPGWKASGRLWGASRGWPVRRERFRLDVAGEYQFRRLVRSWRIANARQERDPETRRRRISSARQMLKAPEGWAGRLRGVSEWVPEATAVEMLRWLSWRGYDVQYVDDDTPAGGDDDAEEKAELVQGPNGGRGSEPGDEAGAAGMAVARDRDGLHDHVV